MAMKKTTTGNQMRKTKKTKKMTEGATWRQTMSQLTITVQSMMTIAEIMDFSVMAELIQSSCHQRIQSHFENLKFKFLNDLELDINDQKFNIFDVVSFLEWLARFDLDFKTVTFIDFQPNCSLQRSLFENVERVSKGKVLIEYWQNIASINSRSLKQLHKKWAFSPGEAFQTLKSGIPNLHLDIPTGERLPKDFYLDLLRSSGTKHFKAFYSTDSLEDAVEFVNNFSGAENLQSLNLYLSCCEFSSSLLGAYHVGNILISFFVPIVYKG
ncbi:hypothetical protein B9Z55_014402 [Caenorhabditis nigoni]|uniref:Uncharacterized protein n=2 Tax=Caenorhabditis nigoni TaxID=1611254 RepID=A0A2G5U6K2_9PELO|nr:hypothetical protein B9Z55_014402 [Caenorhabditis nigoni]